MKKRIFSLLLSALIMTALLSTTVLGEVTNTHQMQPVESEISTVFVEPGEIEFQEMPEHYVIPSEPSVNPIRAAAGAFSVGAKTFAGETSMHINDLDLENMHVVEERNVNSINTFAITSGYYDVFTDYITSEGGTGMFGYFLVSPGEKMTVQLDVPNTSSIDYDLEVYEYNISTGQINLVASSINSTYINAGSGSCPETTAVYNNGTSVKYYILLVESWRGFSTVMPYRLHVGINTNVDSYNALGQNPSTALEFDLSPIGSSTINIREFDTLCENHWYAFTGTENTVKISYNNVGLNSMQLYSPTVDGGLKQEFIMENGEFKTTIGNKYYIRFFSTGASSLAGAKYNITITPSFVPNYVAFYALAPTSAFSFGNKSRWTFDYRYSFTLAVSGGVGKMYNGVPYAIPNADVEVKVINAGWPNGHTNQIVSGTAKSNINGEFSMNLSMRPPAGSQNEYQAPFKYYFDPAMIYLRSGTEAETFLDMWIISHTTN